MKTVYLNQIIFVFNFVCFTTLSASNIYTPYNANVATTIQPTRPEGSIKCFKCTSWTNNYCTKRAGLAVALQYFPVVWCSADCIKMVMEHDGVTDVIRGCSSGGAQVKKTTCDTDHCNHGTAVRTVYTTLTMAIVCNLLFID